MYTEQTVLKDVHSDEFGNVLWQWAHRVFKDGEKISERYERGSVSPGCDVSKLDQRIQTFAQATWTPEMIAPFTQAVLTAIDEHAAAVAALEVAKAADPV